VNPTRQTFVMIPTVAIISKIPCHVPVRRILRVRDRQPVSEEKPVRYGSIEARRGREEEG